MRVVCPSVEDFIANLGAAQSLFQDTIWCSIIRRPSPDAKNKLEAVKFDVVLQASAVVVFDEDESSALIETGIECGRDYTDADAEDVGTQEALRLKGLLQDYAEQRNAKILPGVIDY